MSLAWYHRVSDTLLLIKMSSGNLDVVSKGLEGSLDRLDKTLKVLDRRDRDLLCKWRVLLPLPPPLPDKPPPLPDKLALSNLSFLLPFIDPSRAPSPEYVDLCRPNPFEGEPNLRRPRSVLERLSLSSRSLGAALMSMLSRICDTSEGVMPMAFTYPAAEPYFLFMYSMVLCMV